MKLTELLSGRPDFASKAAIIQYVRTSKKFDAASEDLAVADAMMIFTTSKQHTWLVATGKRLYCILDDIRKDKPNVNWSIPSESMFSGEQMTLAIRAREKTPITGLVDFGDQHRDWLVSKRLFGSGDIQDQIKAFISKQMLPGSNDA